MRSGRRKQARECKGQDHWSLQQWFSKWSMFPWFLLFSFLFYQDFAETAVLHICLHEWCLPRPKRSIGEMIASLITARWGCRVLRYIGTLHRTLLPMNDEYMVLPRGGKGTDLADVLAWSHSGKYSRIITRQCMAVRVLQVHIATGMHVGLGRKTVLFMATDEGPIKRHKQSTKPASNSIDVALVVKLRNSWWQKCY